MDFTKDMNEFYYRTALYELKLMNHGDCYSGLSYNSMLYITVISFMEDCTASKLAEELHITKSAVTIKINELVKQGAVLKTQSKQDKRVFYLALSKSMQDVIHTYCNIFYKIGEELKTHYTTQEMALFSEMLHTISGYDWRDTPHESWIGERNFD